MSRAIFTLLFVTLALSADAASVQIRRSSTLEAQQVQRVSRRKLAGPRFGVTLFTGEVADLRDQADLSPMMTQFGWQWETQLMFTPNGDQALLEWVVLVGGVEQNEFNLSLGFLAGYRMQNGIEFGVGPNISFTKESDDATTSMLIAVGHTFPVGDLQLPVNFAVGLGKGGPRLTTLIGWIVG